MKLEARACSSYQELVSTLEKIAEEAVFRFSPDGLKINSVLTVSKWLMRGFNPPLCLVGVKEILNG